MSVAKGSNNIIDIKDVRKLLRIVTGNWYIIVLSLGISYTLAYFNTYKLPNIYAAKTQFLLHSEDEMYPIQQGLFQSLGLFNSSYEKQSNEKRVLTSKDLVEQVVSKLKLDVTYYIVGRIQTKEVYFGTPFNVEAQIYSSEFYDFPFTFKIKDIDNYEISYDVKDQHIVEQHKFDEPVINKNYYLLIKKSAEINKSTVSTLKEITYQFIVHDKNSLISSYKSAIQVQDLDYTAILEVSLQDEIPERAIMFLDTLARVYVANSLKSKIKVNENTIQYIDKQLADVTSILDSIERGLENFKNQKDILDLNKEQSEYFSYLNGYILENRKFNLQLKSLDYLKSYIISNMNKELLPPALYIDNSDGYLKQAIGELYNLQVKINGALFTTTEKSTSVKEAEYKIELLRNDILKYIVNTTNAINQKIETNNGEISYYTDLLKGVPENQRQILNIDRKLQVNEKMYGYLLEKRAETVIARASIVSEISVIESAHSVGVVGPNKKKIFYSYLSTGLVIALIIAFVRTIFFSKINSMEELKEMTTLPVLGEIFHSEEAQDSYLIVDANPRSFITEAFRSLRTNLDYFAPDVKSKTVLITSNRPGVGKTFCSVNLGAILAKGGKNVLLIELDLHKPKIHTALNVTSETGISSVLADKASLQSAIIKSPIENLDVILSGPAPPNASELILSSRLAELLEYAKTKYDYILIDTPPMGIISDALMLMKYSDINLFILNTKQNVKEGLNYAHNLIDSNSNVKGFVFVMNNVKPKYSKYYSKKYNYSEYYGSDSLQVK